MSDLTEVATLAKNASTRIVFSLTEYKGQRYVDVREHVTSATYTGFTKKGIRLHGNQLDEFIEKLQKVKSALSKAAGDGTPSERPDGPSGPGDGKVH